MWDRMSFVAAGVAWVAWVAGMAGAAVAAPVDLTFRAAEGTELRYRSEGTNEMVQGASGMNLELAWSSEHVAVLKVLERGAEGTRLSLRYESVKGEAKMPSGVVKVDTTAEKAAGEPAVARTARELVGKEITFLLTDEGVEGLRSPVTLASPEAHLLLGPLVTPEQLSEALEGLLVVTSEKDEVEPGTTWEETETQSMEQMGTLRSVQTYKAGEPSGGVLPLEYSAEVTLENPPAGTKATVREGDVSGTIRWDVEKGVVRLLEGKSVIDIALDYQGVPVTFTVRNTSKTELVEGSGE